MNTKEKIVQSLEEAKGKYVSGGSLAEAFGLSRNAIWKGINELKKAGYPIESVKNKGYRLSESSDIISKAGIALCLEKMEKSSCTDELADRLFVYESLDSTNTQAVREMLADGLEMLHNTTIVAKRQSSGRGHRGAGFESPEGGIYLSMILDPGKLQNPESVPGAVAGIVTETVKKLYGVEIRGGKDNSLYLGKEKIGGILTEGISDLETGICSSCIVGIGIRADRLCNGRNPSPQRNLVIAALMISLAKL
ncbi:MAG: HTH domain-containing protein [Lachnospiraceae bacterium]|nr:HTH domain-containing protein [Lachnospiraceae bacterium]